MKNLICSWFLAAAVLLPGSLNIAAARDDDLRFAIMSAVASDPSYANYRELTHYIAARLGRKSVFISGLSYSQVDNLFKGTSGEGTTVVVRIPCGSVAETREMEQG